MAQSRQAAAGGQFSAVDRAVQEQRAWLLRMLDFQNAAPGMRDSKRHMRDLLALVPGLAVLDVGCGAGDDARLMAEQVAPTGRVVGIDTSDFMVEEARRRAAIGTLPLTFSPGDVQRLDFADDTFDCCRCERVLQHVADPAQALAELVRVTKSGGHVVVADGDWAACHTSDPTTQALYKFNARSTRNPKVGRNLGRLFRACGLREISVRLCPFTVVGAEWNSAFIEMMQPLVASALAAGAISVADAARWPEAMAQDGRDGIAFAAQPYFVVAGTKP
jgi:ubiquinone/menaquinone biosynthesis C-methylase UbiE